MDSDFRTRRGRLRGFSINRLIPNLFFFFNDTATTEIYTSIVPVRSSQ